MLLKYSRIKRKLKDSNWIKLCELPEEERRMIKKVMKSLGIFRVNSFDAQVILRDLIGMAQEMDLRDSSLKEEIGEDLTGYVNELVENSKRAFPLEYITYFGKRIFLSMFWITLLLGFISPYESIPLMIFLFGIMVVGELYHGIVVPNYQTEKKIRKRIPDLIYVILVIPFIIITLTNALSANFSEVNLRILSIIFGGIYVVSKIGYLWAQKQLIEGREHLVEE